MRLLLSIFLLISLSCCVVSPPPTPPQPIPPGPVPPEPAPVPPVPVPDEVLVPRWTFDTLRIGDPVEALLALPEPHTVAEVGQKTIYVWSLDEKRASGGQVQWEVHVLGGTIILSVDF